MMIFKWISPEEASKQLKEYPDCVSINGERVFAMYRDDAFVGCIGLDEKTASRFVMRFVSVLPEHIGKGYGRVMVENFLLYISGLYPELKVMGVQYCNKYSRQLFENLGFKAEPRYGGCDMWKNLY